MSGWEPERVEEHWSDTDSWRGDLHVEGDEPWRGETLAVWDDEEEASSDSEEDDLPGEEFDWPENLAGPEYWLFKRDGM